MEHSPISPTVPFTGAARPPHATMVDSPEMNPYEDAMDGHSGFATLQGAKDNEAKRDDDSTPDKTRDVRPRR
eukprot:7752580-Heterocapsa_arctica.AAC.1